MRQFLAGLVQGESLDHMGQQVYGRDMAALAASLDPLVLGDPLGKVVESSPYGSKSAHLMPHRAVEVEERRREQARLKAQKESDE
jgi:hypothetical protein